MEYHATTTTLLLMRVGQAVCSLGRCLLLRTGKSRELAQLSWGDELHRRVQRLVDEFPLVNDLAHGRTCMSLHVDENQGSGQSHFICSQDERFGQIGERERIELLEHPHIGSADIGCNLGEFALKPCLKCIEFSIGAEPEPHGVRVEGPSQRHQEQVCSGVPRKHVFHSRNHVGLRGVQSLARVRKLARSSSLCDEGFINR